MSVETKPGAAAAASCRLFYRRRGRQQCQRPDPSAHRKRGGRSRDAGILSERGGRQIRRCAGNIETESPVLRNFGFLVTGSADNGMRTYLFNCRFDPTGKFLGLEAT